MKLINEHMQSYKTPADPSLSVMKSSLPTVELCDINNQNKLDDSTKVPTMYRSVRMSDSVTAPRRQSSNPREPIWTLNVQCLSWTYLNALETFYIRQWRDMRNFSCQAQSAAKLYKLVALDCCIWHIYDCEHTRFPSVFVCMCVCARHK